MVNKIFFLVWSVVMLVSNNLLSEEIETLPLNVISYDQLVNQDEQAIATLVDALFGEGIVGIRNVPGYEKKLANFLAANQSFVSLSDEIKEKYAPDREAGDLFLGYEAGKEEFQLSDGTWAKDDLKVSYYAVVPDQPENKWPIEMDLKTAFQDLGLLMASIGDMILEKINLIGPATGIDTSHTPKTGRMLFYQKNEDTNATNPFWCGSHFDHAMFTALTPATYFVDGKRVDEPEEAGLFVKIDDRYVKVKSDPEVLLFQVGEFGQLVSNDAICATEHRVHKANSTHVERYAMALFFDVPLDTVIHSTSCLTQDDRYDGGSGDPCSFQHWKEESFKRYIVEEIN